MNEQVQIEVNIEAALRLAIAEGDAREVTELLDPLPFSEALRELLALPPAERDTVLEIVPAAVIALAIFLAMVSDMSGCSGKQAGGVTTRELSLGLVRPFDAFRVWLKEISVGVINGIALGVLIGVVAWVWKGNPALGLVIGAALALNTMRAVSIGVGVPLLLKRLGQDPAAASGPLLTTITDRPGSFLSLVLQR